MLWSHTINQTSIEPGWSRKLWQKCSLNIQCVALAHRVRLHITTNWTLYLNISEAILDCCTGSLRDCHHLPISAIPLLKLSWFIIQFTLRVKYKLTVSALCQCVPTNTCRCRGRKFAFFRTQKHMQTPSHNMHKYSHYQHGAATVARTHIQIEDPSAWNKQNGCMPFGSPGKWILLTEQLASWRQDNLYSIHHLYCSRPSFSLHPTVAPHS